MLHERFHDKEEKVRLEVVRAVCEAAAESIKIVPQMVRAQLGLNPKLHFIALCLELMCRMGCVWCMGYGMCMHTLGYKRVRESCYHGVLDLITYCLQLLDDLQERMRDKVVCLIARHYNNCTSLEFIVHLHNYAHVHM